MRVLVLVAIAACRAPAPAPGTPEDLAAYLRGVASGDEATRRRAITGWIVDEAAWRRIVVPPYAALWPDYARGFDARVAALVVRLGPGAITTRRHYAGDPRLTSAQARVRWALPVEYPSAVAELDGAPIDAVFVHDGAHWRVLAGLDALLLDRVRALDPACAVLLARAGPIGHCTEVGWLVADAALRPEMERGGLAPTRGIDRERFAHACKLATTLCANPTP